MERLTAMSLGLMILKAAQMAVSKEMLIQKVQDCLGVLDERRHLGSHLGMRLE